MRASAEFRELWEMAQKKKEEYDFLYMVGDDIIANIHELGKINNCILAYKDGENLTYWEVCEQKPIQIPKPISLVFISRRKLKGVIGPAEAEESYIKFSKKTKEAPCDRKLSGVIELETYTLAFEFDWSTGKSHSVLYKNYDEEESSLFVMMKSMMQLGEKRHDGLE